MYSICIRWSRAACNTNFILCTASVLYECTFMQPVTASNRQRLTLSQHGAALDCMCTTAQPTHAHASSGDRKVKAPLVEVLGGCWLLQGKSLGRCILFIGTSFQEDPHNFAILYPVGSKFLGLLVTKEDCRAIKGSKELRSTARTSDIVPARKPG